MGYSCRLVVCGFVFVDDLIVFGLLIVLFGFYSFAGLLFGFVVLWSHGLGCLLFCFPVDYVLGWVLACYLIAWIGLLILY